MNRKDSDGAIMTSRVNFDQCMSNPIKSHQDKIINDQVISVNTLFSSEISKPERT